MKTIGREFFSLGATILQVLSPLLRGVLRDASEKMFPWIGGRWKRRRKNDRRASSPRSPPYFGSY